MTIRLYKVHRRWGRYLASRYLYGPRGWEGWWS